MSKDRDLGMDRKITRRDFVEGASVAIANSDAGAFPTMQEAIDQAHRAIGDLNGQGA
jgi:hypothetical protein